MSDSSARYGIGNVILSDILKPPDKDRMEGQGDRKRKRIRKKEDIEGFSGCTFLFTSLHSLPFFLSPSPPSPPSLPLLPLLPLPLSSLSSLSPEPYIYADVTDMKDMHSIVVNNNIDTVVHFSAILSALGEKDVQKALAVSF